MVMSVLLKADLERMKYVFAYREETIQHTNRPVSLRSQVIRTTVISLTRRS